MGRRIGIIAEYNPFHNGHLYQIQKAKELTGADTVIAVMSGNFTQRGDTSLINKFEIVTILSSPASFNFISTFLSKIVGLGRIK